MFQGQMALARMAQLDRDLKDMNLEELEQSAANCDLYDGFKADMLHQEIKRRRADQVTAASSNIRLPALRRMRESRPLQPLRQLQTLRQAHQRTRPASRATSAVCTLDSALHTAAEYAAMAATDHVVRHGHNYHRSDGNVYVWLHRDGFQYGRCRALNGLAHRAQRYRDSGLSGRREFCRRSLRHIYRGGSAEVRIKRTGAAANRKSSASRQLGSATRSKSHSSALTAETDLR